jgi:hypothetical protein
MIVILGLVILVAALAAGAAGVLAHAGHAHAALLAQSRRETAAVSQQRDDLISQRDTARAYTVLDEQRNYTASTFGDGDGRPRAGRDPGPPMPPPAVTSF